MAAKALSATLTVRINGDLTREQDEFFLVNLANAVNATIADQVAVGTILNDDVLRARFLQFSAGFTSYSPGTLVPSWGDYDNDGDVDLPLYRNDGYGTFSEIPGFRALLAQGNYHGSSWGDFDRDGRLDLLIQSYNLVPTRTLLLHNLGDGQFADVAPELGLDVQGFGETALWADFNLDGWPDLFAPYYSHVAPFKSYMYYNHGGTQLVDVADSVGVALRNVPASLKVEGADVADWDDDGDLDFYAASHLFVNDGTGRFTDVRAQVGLPERFDEGAAFVDFDNDGDLDLSLRNQDTARLYRNDGGTFTDVTVAAGIPPAPFMWGDGWADVDNDGDLDLLMFVNNQPARLMLNQGDGTFALDSAFAALGTQTGLSAWADVDGDGDLDVVTGASPTPILYKNQLESEPGFANSYIRVRVVDALGRQTEHGATVRLRRVNGPSNLVQTRVVCGGASYLDRSEYTVHFGVADNGPYSLEVSFPSPPSSRVIVDGERSPILASISPTNLAGQTVVVFRDGRVALDAGPPGRLAVPSGGVDADGLGPPAPNPIQSAATIAFRLASRGYASLVIYDVGGRRVRRLATGAMPAGAHTAHWDCRDDRGARVPAGIYFYQLSSSGRLSGRRRVVVLP